MRRKLIANHLLLPEVCRMVSEGQSVKIRVKGVSMIPFLFGDRDEVFLSPINQEVLKVGEIVLALLPRENRYVLHRIIEIRKNHLILMGDGNTQGVEHCRTEDVQAKVCRVIRNGKEQDLSSVAWQRYARCWRRLLPIRRYLLWVFRSIGDSRYLKESIKRKLKR